MWLVMSLAITSKKQEKIRGDSIRKLVNVILGIVIITIALLAISHKTNKREQPTELEIIYFVLPDKEMSQDEKAQLEGMAHGIISKAETSLQAASDLMRKTDETTEETSRQNIDNSGHIDSTIQAAQVEQPSEYSQSDLDMLAAIVHLESQGESDLGQQAVAQVVINRVNSPSFPNTIEGVIYQSGQFSPSGRVRSTTPSQRCYENAKMVYEGYRPIPDNVLYFSVGKAAGKQPYQKIGNHWFCYG